MTYIQLPQLRTRLCVPSTWATCDEGCCRGLALLSPAQPLGGARAVKEISKWYQSWNSHERGKKTDEGGIRDESMAADKRRVAAAAHAIGSPKGSFPAALSVFHRTLPLRGTVPCLASSEILGAEVNDQLDATRVRCLDDPVQAPPTRTAGQHRSRFSIAHILSSEQSCASSAARATGSIKLRAASMEHGFSWNDGWICLDWIGQASDGSGCKDPRVSNAGHRGRELSGQSYRLHVLGLHRPLQPIAGRSQPNQPK